jgi:type VI secretion system secreted protein VgrG
MGGLFTFELELISPNNELSFDDVVGQKVTAILVLEDDERYFNGFITEFKYLGFDGVYSRYHATVRPWLWLLTRTSDCRIFQNMTVPDIIKEVFKLNKMTDFRPSLSATYREWDYCVQYRESDFNFISRLMEQEGIYYFFEHEIDKHVLVMADDASAHSTYPGFDKIPFNSAFEKMGADFNSLDTWAATQSFMPSKYTMLDYDFENPKADMLSVYNKEFPHAQPIEDSEIFDYPGEYVKRDDGKNYVEVRLQEFRCQQERMHATGGCRGLSPGCSFDLVDYGREDQNKEYLTIAIEHEINNSSFFADQPTGEPVYRCKVEVMDKEKLPFRAPRKTPKPIVQGPQTAMVVGPSADEIYTDEYGRVKVQFHWDRYGKKDENSSCWVRVSQLWAGTKWGGIHIPRIGQEVVVSFLEGDPDRPMITGSVYNANCMPPYDLAGNKTQSGIKSRSTKGGGPDNFNELRFEDKKGGEEVYLHAEKDLTVKVEDSEAETVGNSITTNAGTTISRNAGKDINRTADDNITEKAGKNITTNSGKNMKLTSGGSYELFTNLGIHLKAMNFVAGLIESGAKQAAKAIMLGGAGSAAGTMAGIDGAGEAGSGAAIQGTLAALSPAIEGGAAEITALQNQAVEGAEGLGDQSAAGEAAIALNDAIDSGASPEVLGAAFMALADAALDTYSDAKKIIEGLFPQIPSIELWAMKDVNAHALWSMSLSTKTRDISIEAQNKDINVKAKKNIKIEAESQDIDIKASKKNIQITGKEKISIKAEDKDLVIEAGKKKVKITSPDQIFLKCGGASISMAKSGNIVIKGAKVNIKGSGPVTVKGTPIKLN